MGANIDDVWREGRARELRHRKWRDNRRDRISAPGGRWVGGRSDGGEEGDQQRENESEACGDQSAHNARSRGRGSGSGKNRMRTWLTGAANAGAVARLAATVAQFFA